MKIGRFYPHHPPDLFVEAVDLSVVSSVALPILEGNRWSAVFTLRDVVVQLLEYVDHMGG